MFHTTGPPVSGGRGAGIFVPPAALLRRGRRALPEDLSNLDAPLGGRRGDHMVAGLLRLQEHRVALVIASRRAAVPVPPVIAG